MAWNPVSRVYPNRVSFRLLIYAIIANLVFETTFLPGANTPGAGCAASAFLSTVHEPGIPFPAILTLNHSPLLFFSSCMLCCMAINLHLVLIHGVNDIVTEKYYILFSLLLTFACTLTTLGSGHFGFCTLNDTCWFTASSPAEAYRHPVVVDPIHAVLFLVLVWYKLMQQRRTARVHYALTLDPTDLVTSRMATTIAPIVQYRAIILRIGLYPILSCTLNCFGIILDLYLVRKLAGMQPILGLDLLSLCIYSLRPLFYGFLAATDPVFLRALHVLLSPDPAPSTTSSQKATKR